LTRLLRSRRALAGPAALFGLALIFFSVVFMTGGNAHGQEPLVSTTPADILAGSQLFQEHCQSCHGYQGSGNDQVGAPPLINVGAAAADFYLSTGRMPLASPSQQAVRHHPFFTPIQIRQLVAYVNALPQITGVGVGGPTIPTVNPICPTAVAPNPNPTGCVTLSQGQSLFAVNCGSCHQAAGAGGMLSKGNVVPSLYNANITQIAEAMRVGPKPMPVFSSTMLDQSQMSAVARYVQYLQNLQHTGNAGGLPIGHFGPVPEGVIGIIAGFVVLWFVVRMIGTRG
jgi:ubiquinol-cytochrome c reductase cytochrome c subunit